MGIRIHKALGYGLDDVRPDSKKEWFVDDPRFRTDGYFSRDEDISESFKMDDFIAHLENVLKNKKDEDSPSHWLSYELENIKDGKNKCKWSFYNVIHHQGEFGLPNVIVFQPFSEDWYRFDDIVDWIEASDNDNLNAQLKVFPNRNIYPYHDWCDLRTGKSYIEFEDEKLNFFEIKRSVEMCRHNASEIINKLGFESKEEFDKFIVPMVPEIIVEYCKFLKIFKYDVTAYTLKPMLYTYWC